MKVEAKRSFLLMRDGKRIELEKGEQYEVSQSEFDENWHHGLVAVDEDAEKEKAGKKK